MNSFKPTPGPWIAPLNHEGSKGRAVWTADGSTMICLCQSAGTSLGGEQANARLCAAAADLLEALSEVVAMLNDPDADEFHAARIESLCSSVISKATGDHHGRI